MSATIDTGSERTQTPDPVQTSPQEWQTRVDLAACYRLVAHFGWDDLIFTHISARVPGPEHQFLINPFGWLFGEITASSLVKVDLAGNVVGETASPVNPAGFTIHSAVHAAREDAACVLHLHTVAGVAVSSQAAGLLPLNQTALLVGEHVAYHEYEGVAFDLAERPRLVADLGSRNAMLLRNHGTLALGPSVPAAFLTMYFLERACATQVATLAGGGAVHYPPESARTLVGRQAAAGRGTIDGIVWTALMRLLDRTDPSYKT
ncbi:MAG: class II aldolase/adducin family protein [Vulcanimicrobiaceae bacterium]